MGMKYSLAIAAIMKYEEPYVVEWVKYHLAVGVKHFYIYDNNNVDSGMAEVLKPFIDDGIVDLIPFYGPIRQLEAYNHAIANYKFDCKYIAMIDADEYIVPIEDVQVDELIDSLITKYYDHPLGFAGGLVLRWQVYGTSNHKTRPEGLVLENYLYVQNGRLDCHLKTIVNPRVVAKFINPHYCRYQPNYSSIDSNGNRIKGPTNSNVPRDIIRLNHYHYKSEEEFIDGRLRKGKADQVVAPDKLRREIHSHLQDMKESNKEIDNIMLRYIDRIK